MATLKEILSKDQLLAMEDFADKEAEKLLARAKELNKESKALPYKNSAEGLNILMEAEHLTGKLEGINLIMDELERLAKIS